MLRKFDFGKVLKGSIGKCFLVNCGRELIPHNDRVLGPLKEAIKRGMDGFPSAYLELEHE